MASVDLTVMGAGVFGLAVSYACLQRGAKVQIIDPRGVAAGASGGVIGALSPHTPDNWNDKKQFQLESLLMARTFWPEVEAHSGMQTGFRARGRVQLIPDQRALELAHMRANSAPRFWAQSAHWNVVTPEKLPSLLIPAASEITKLGQWVHPGPTGYVIYDTLSAQLHPRMATTALSKAVQRLGGTIRREGKPKGRIIWATGVAGLQELSRGRTRPVGQGVKGQAALLRGNFSPLPQLQGDGIYVVAHPDGTVGVGSTSENTFAHDEPDATLEDLIAQGRKMVPALADAQILSRWAGIRPRARSRAPMLGPWPAKADQYVVNGGFRIGFGMAPKVAQVMADLVLEDLCTYPPSFAVEQSL